MPDYVTIPVSRVEELASSARETARAWGRQCIVPDDWHEFVIEDFTAVSAILGVELATHPIRLYGGGTRPGSRVFFSGFSSQGDGASFEGRYRYARCSAANIRAHAPADDRLHRIADGLAAVQRRNLYQLAATIRRSGRYCHEYTMSIDVERLGPTGQAPIPNAEHDVAECLRDLARWLYRRLEAEYEFLTSDEQIDAALRDNDLTFTAAGTRFP